MKNIIINQFLQPYAGSAFGGRCVSLTAEKLGSIGGKTTATSKISTTLTAKNNNANNANNGVNVRPPVLYEKKFL